MGTPYFWLTGVFKNYDSGSDTDEWALAKPMGEHVVPVHIDFTAHHTIPFLKKMETVMMKISPQQLRKIDALF
jgi:5'-nucleotidase